MFDLSVPVTYPFLSHFGQLPDPTGCNQNRIELPPLETTEVEKHFSFCLISRFKVGNSKVTHHQKMNQNF